MKAIVKNEGKLDRVVRIVLGITLLSLVFFGPQSLWGLIGIIPLVTGILGTCPIYRLLGVDTCSRESQATEPRV